MEELKIRLMALGLIVLNFIESTFCRDDWQTWWDDKEGEGWCAQDVWLLAGLFLLAWAIFQAGRWFYA